MSRQRAACPWCGRSVAVKASGVLFRHGRARGVLAHDDAAECPGTGRRPGDVEGEGGPRTDDDQSQSTGAGLPNRDEPNDTPAETVEPADLGIAEAVVAELRPKVPPGGPVWKSLLGSTGSGYACERATLYREVHRDPATGYRLDFGASERIVFGIAVDAALRVVMEAQVEHGPTHAGVIGHDTSEEGIGEPLPYDVVAQLAARATAHGVDRCRGVTTEEPWSDDQWAILRVQLATAVDKFLGLWPNRVDGKAGAEDDPWSHRVAEPDGTPDGPPVAWLPLDGLELQLKLTAPDVVGGRGVSGKPDFAWRRDGIIEGWVDGKAGKARSFPAAWTSSEVVTYDHMVTVDNGGVPPAWHGYLEYVRNIKPYWQLRFDDVRADASLALAAAYFERWGRALDEGDPEAVSFTPAGCGSCGWRDAIPNAGHTGCRIGQAVIRLTQEVPEHDQRTDQQAAATATVVDDVDPRA